MPAVKSEDGLTDKQRAFVLEYLSDFSATKAAIRAGYSKNTASEQGYQLLQKTSVSEAIAAAQAERAKRIKMDQARIAEELQCVALATPLDYMDVTADGVRVKDLSQLSPEQQRCISEITESRHSDGTVTVRVKLYDRVKAMDLLNKATGAYTKKIEVSGGLDLTRRLEEARARVLSSRD